MFEHVFKKNPYHDKSGRFTSKDKAARAAPKPATLAEHYARYDDPHVTPEKVLAAFTAAERAEVALAEKRAANTPTTSQTYKDKNGQWKPERAKLHQEIVREYLSAEKIKAATPEPGHKPTFIVLGGRGGSGKSAFTHDEHSGREARVREFDSKKFLVLDSDEIKKRLKPPYEGWNAASVHEESAEIFDAITEAAMGFGLNIVHDATLRSGGVERTVQQMKQMGYRIEGHYMFVPRQESAKRAIQRYLGKGPKDRGRLVPVRRILENTENEKNFDNLKRYFHRWSAYDNQGKEPTLITRGGAK